MFYYISKYWNVFPMKERSYKNVSKDLNVIVTVYSSWFDVLKIYELPNAFGVESYWIIKIIILKNILKSDNIYFDVYLFELIQNNLI